MQCGQGICYQRRRTQNCLSQVKEASRDLARYRRTYKNEGSYRVCDSGAISLSFISV